MWQLPQYWSYHSPTPLNICYFLEMIVSILPWLTCRQIFQNTGTYEVKMHLQTAKQKTGQVICWRNSTCFTIIIAENLAPNMQPLITSTVNYVSTPICYCIGKSISKTLLTLFTKILTYSLEITSTLLRISEYANKQLTSFVFWITKQ